MGDNKIPEALKELRIQNGMTQAQFSKKLNIARQTYSAYERGVRTPDLDLVKMWQNCTMSLWTGWF